MIKMRRVKADCKFYNGHLPCKPHKAQGAVCQECKIYQKLGKRILIIKLGAAGDVIRTTPLLSKIREKYPNAEVVWLTCFPDLVPGRIVNKTLNFELKNTLWLSEQKFDWLINLDKDDEAIALAEKIKAGKKSGFGMDAGGKCRPLGNKAALDKWQTGLWDDLNKINTRNYMQEIFSICGFEFSGEEYILEKKASLQWPGIDKSKRVIGLNTGCGGRWITRLWSNDNWVDLAVLLKDRGFEVVLLGGPQEHEKNLAIAKKADVKYPGYFDFPGFIDLVDQCDTIVSQVTMAMHIAIGLKKKLVLINNIFNKHEFFLYDRGSIIEPELKCLGCFKQKFDKNCPVDNCMDLIIPETVFEKIIS